MANIVETLELPLGTHDQAQLSPEQQERERLEKLLGDPFSCPEITSNETKRQIVEELTAKIKSIREGNGTPDKFFAFQDQVLDNPEYDFLSRRYPGLNVSGWRVLLAELDPLRYGKDIRRVVEGRGTGGKGIIRGG